MADTGNAVIRRVSPAGAVTTIAGQPGVHGYADGPASAAKFDHPTGLAVAPDGTLFVGDSENHVVRKITPAGVVTTFAGTPGVSGYVDGPGAEARFDRPDSMSIDPITGDLFVADPGVGEIRRVGAGGAVSTFVTTPATGGSAITFDPSGNLLVATYVETIARVGRDGHATTICGGGSHLDEGPALDVRLRQVSALAVDDDGGVYIADYSRRIRRLATDGTVAIVAFAWDSAYRDGPALTAGFSEIIRGLAASAGRVFVSDTGNQALRLLSSGVVSTVAGRPVEEGAADGSGDEARFNRPTAIAVGPDGTAYVVDFSNRTIRRITPSGEVSTLAGRPGEPGSEDGIGSQARFSWPTAIAVDSAGVVFVGDECTIRRIDGDRRVTTVAGNAGDCRDLDGLGTDARLVFPKAMDFGPDGTLYFTTFPASVRKMLPNGVVATLVGGNEPGIVDGPPGVAKLQSLTGLAVDRSGMIWVSDGARFLRRITPDGTVTTVAGRQFPLDVANPDGHGTDAFLDDPYGLSVDAHGNVFIADTGYNVIRMMTASGDVTTIAGRLRVPGHQEGEGAAARFDDPHDVAVGPDGRVWIVDRYNQAIRIGEATGRVRLTVQLVTEFMPPGQASVSSDPPVIACGPVCGADLDRGTRVTLRAAVAWPYVFNGWSGGGCLGTGDCTVTLADTAFVQARFSRCSYSLSSLFVSVTDEGGEGRLRMTASPGCEWHLRSTVPWLTVTSGGVGDGDITYVVAPNEFEVPRSTQVLDGLTGTAVAFNVTQAPAGSTAVFTSYLAEGATSDFFSTRLALFNPAEYATNASLVFARNTAAPIPTSIVVPARTRVTVDPSTVAGLARAEFSTTVTANQDLVVDRTMWWGAEGYGAHSDTAVTTPSPSWFMAEGATHSGFDLFYLLQNPSSHETTVRVNYLRPAGDPITKDYPLPPKSRSNVWVNVEEFAGLGRALASTDVSASFQSLDGTPFIAERAMYLSRPGHPFDAGHQSAGVATPSNRWILAEGNTGPYFDLFVLVANPSDLPADVRLTYLLPSGDTLERRFRAAPHSRSNVWVDWEQFEGIDGYPLADTAVSTIVESENGVPIVVERALWWPGDFETWQEAHNSPGATQSGTTWAIADGEVGFARGTETYLLVAMATPVGGWVRVTVYREDGRNMALDYLVPGSSRRNISLGHDFGDFVRDQRFSAIVQTVGLGTHEIVVERAMYWNANGVAWAAGTNALAKRLR